MTTKAITVVGSSNTDMIMKLGAIPRPGETVLGGTFSQAAGGKGANQAVAAARLGGQVHFVARVGSDSLGEQAVANFENEKIDVRYVSRDPDAASGVALIFIDERGENSIGVASGANMRLTPELVEHATPVLETSRVVLLQLETPLDAVCTAAKIGSEAGALVVLNPAPAQPLPDKLLRHVTILTPNEHEAGLLTGMDVRDVPTAREAAARLLKRGPSAVVITLGAQGCVVATRNDAWEQAAFKVAVVDTTAAGDTFNGALAVGLAEGMNLREAVRLGAAAAAISVTRLGAQPSAPHRAEVDLLLRQHGAAVTHPETANRS